MIEVIETTNLITIWENYELTEVSQYVNVTCEGETSQFEVIWDGELNLLEIKQSYNPFYDDEDGTMDTQQTKRIFTELQDKEKWMNIHDYLLDMDEGEPFYVPYILEMNKCRQQCVNSYIECEDVELKYEILSNNFSTR